MWHPSSVLICTFRHSSSNSSWVVTLMCILPYKIISVLLSLVSLFILVFYVHVAPPVWCSYALLGTLRIPARSKSVLVGLFLHLLRWRENEGTQWSCHLPSIFMPSIVSWKRGKRNRAISDFFFPLRSLDSRESCADCKRLKACFRLKFSAKINFSLSD